MQKRSRIINTVIAFMAVIMLLGCGEKEKDPVVGSKSPGTPIGTVKDEDSEEGKNLYLIRSMDMEAETITLQSIKNGNVLRYPYSLTTKFMDEYGKTSSWNNFYPGRLVTIGDRLKDQILSYVQLSKSAWEKSDIKRYSLDMDRGMLTIGSSKYHISADTPVFSNGNLATYTDIGENDVIRVVGIDKDVYSVSITTGHGYVELQNTELFKDSLMEIGRKIITMISGDGMILEIPEGTYDLTVANNGYGGTNQIEVERGKTTVVDLNDWKGEGPKQCEVTFHIAVEGASIYIDDQKVESDTAMMLDYGRHKIRVEADGYEEFRKILVVNSPKADIALDLSDEEKSSDSSSGSNNSSSGSNDRNSNSGNAENGNNSSSGNASNGSSDGNRNSNNDSNGSSNSYGGTNGNSGGGNDNSYGGNNNNSNNGNSNNNSGKTMDTDYLTTLSQALSGLLGGGN